jgi:hypothetical protein
VPHVVLSCRHSPNKNFSCRRDHESPSDEEYEALFLYDLREAFGY